MRQMAREFLVFGIAPIVIAVMALYGLIGGFTTSQMFVPFYMMGLIIGVTGWGIYTLVLLIRLLRWLTRMLQPRIS